MTELKSGTLTVQSFNMVLEFSPLKANTVGELLTGVNTKQLQTFFIGIQHFLLFLFLLLRLRLTRTTTSVQTSLINTEDIS